MKKTILLVAIFILAGLISCQPIFMIIAKRTGNILPPEEETNESILSYCQNKDVNYDKLFVLKSEDNFKNFLSKYKEVPGIFVFDRNKYLITRAEKTECPWAMLNFLYDSTINKGLIQDTLLYNDVISSFEIIDNRSLNKEFDYYILCAWAKFAPKMTQALFETINKQKKENKLNVCHILLNVDLQKSWESEN